MKTLDAIVGIVVVAGGLHWGLIALSEPAAGGLLSSVAGLTAGLTAFSYLRKRQRRLPVPVRA